MGKPFDNTEVLLRIKNLLETRFLYLQLQNQNLALEAKVRERTRELEQAQVEKHEIGLECFEQWDRQVWVGGPLDLAIAIQLQDALQQADIELLVVDDQNPGGMQDCFLHKMLTK